MLAADPFFSLPRTTRPADWFERILPTLPLKLPRASLDHAIAYHVHGPGGGSWSVPSRPRLNNHPLERKTLFETISPLKGSAP